MSSPPPPTQYDKLASVAIQGGAVYGLTLLGQLQAVLDEGYRIVALSGTSAGAIVATLYWAGVPLETVRAKFVELAGPPNQITNLLGNNRSGRRPMSSAVVNRLLRVSRRVRSATSKSWPTIAVATLTGGADALWQRASAWDDGGIFPGGEFEHLIDQLVRQSPRVAPHVLSGRLPAEGLLTFGDLWSLTEEAEEYFPALTLTATNLTTGLLELIDSASPRFSAVPIATAVRASGGFPLFFTPVAVDLPVGENPAHRCLLVDGGVICNFPGFVFSSTARVRQLGEHEPYRADVMRPWVNIGLRLAETPDDRMGDNLPAVAKRVVKMLTGGSRTILETQLTEVTVERYVPSAVPFDETGWPFGLLDFDRLTPEYVRTMFEAGRRFATRRLEGLAFDLPPADEVEWWMEGLVDAVAMAFGDPENQRWHVRATLFVPQGENLFLHYRANMNSAADTDRHLVFARDEGLAGYCYVRRAPLLCNLERLNGLPYPSDISFQLDPDTQRDVRADRTWLMSVPVFDPRTASPERFLIDPDPTDGEGVFAELESPLDGGVFGVLSVDAGFDYAAIGLNPDPDEQVIDPRLKLAYDTLLSTAWSIGKVFAGYFAIRIEEGQ